MRYIKNVTILENCVIHLTSSELDLKDNIYVNLTIDAFDINNVTFDRDNSGILLLESTQYIKYVFVGCFTDFSFNLRLNYDGMLGDTSFTELLNK